jgi:ABC-type branched-subunit amino acid transport system substrate-binding protein
MTAGAPPVARRSTQRRGRLTALAALGLVVFGSGGVLGAAQAHAAAGHAATGSGTTSSGTMALPVARQDYVTDTPTDPATGQPVDPYNGDPTSIHVAVSSGKELARSFVWVPLSYLPEGTEATDVTARFSVTNQSEASSSGNYAIYNVDTDTAIIEACVLTTELPSTFDPDHPPAYDCADGSAVGKPDQGYDTWTFDLRDLVAYWNAHGDTGAALVPIAPSPTATFSVSFYTSLSEARATYAPVAGQPATGGAAPAASVPSGSAGSGASASGAPAAGSGAGVASAGGAVPSRGAGAGGEGSVGPGEGSGLPGAAVPAAASSSPSSSGASTGNGSKGGPSSGAGLRATPGQASSLASASSARANQTGPPGEGSRPWPWVLAGCLALSAATLGAAHRRRLAAAARRLVPSLGRAFRAHPRAHTVATLAAAWGLVFASYSIVTTPSHGGLATAASESAVAGPRAGAAGNVGASTGVLGGSAGPTGAVGSSALPSGGGGSGVPLASAGTAGATGGATLASASKPAVPAASQASTEFSGNGTWQTIDGIRVFFPAGGGPPVADLYHGANDTVGISPTSIKLCVHAALTYGPAFNISASDLNVYWDWLNAHGGIFGRKIVTNYENDNYDPGQAVQAAQACKDWGAFLLIGGIGFDQVPAVRQWAEQNHELYLYTTATSQDTSGLRYSFTAQPSVEQMGAAMGEVAVHQFAGKKVGIIYRNSSNWTPGVTTFEQVVHEAGMQIVGAYPVTINQGNYLSELTELRSAGAQVVFAWENALAVTEMVEQAQGQAYYPAWLLPAFNLETNTLGSASLDQPMWAAQPWDTYDPGYYGGGFAPIAPYIHEFEAQYKTYDPSADLAGDGGDLLFQTWEGWVELARMLQLCGPGCTRNKLAGLWLAGYDQTVPPDCNVDFGRTSDHHEGGYLFQVLHVVKDPNGRANFVPVQRCVTIGEIR